jgi:two-component system sensor histidine kinase AgrC
MIAATKHVEAISYLDSLLDDSDELNELIRLKHSALAALLKAKVVIAKSKDIDFQILIKASLENIKIKPHEVVNIMGNLIDNAIEALENLAPGNRKLIFSITSSKGFFTFHVINSGIIKKEILDNIFEKHFTTKDQSKHSGIGLSTVKKLVIKNKGDIGVNSSPENGTVFTVILPAEE